ncbi:MAG: hypothetical protein ABI378_09505 [Chitinophagaceae bacterium]
MPRRYRHSYKRKSNGGSGRSRGNGDGILILFAIAAVILIALIKVILFLLAIIGTVTLFTIYFRWQAKQLETHNGSWKAFWQNVLRIRLQYLFVGLLSFSAIYLYSFQPVTAILLVFFSTLVYPITWKFLHRRFELKKTIWILSVLGFCLIILGLFSNQQYEKITEKSLQKEQIIETEVRNESDAKDSALKKKQEKTALYISSAEKFIELKNFKKATTLLDSAALEYPESHKISYQRGVIFFLTGRYTKAILQLDRVSESEVDVDNLHFIKAKCYLKEGRKQEAIPELRQSITLGNVDAERLYNKVNPIIRRIVGYRTLCCDGTISDARERGACSWHGGVCNWNDPIYEESRKYPEN